MEKMDKWYVGKPKNNQQVRWKKLGYVGEDGIELLPHPKNLVGNIWPGSMWSWASTVVQTNSNWRYDGEMRGYITNNQLHWWNCNISLPWIKALGMISLNLRHDSRLRSQWGRYSLPRLHVILASQNGSQCFFVPTQNGQFWGNTDGSSWLRSRFWDLPVSNRPMAIC